MIENAQSDSTDKDIRFFVLIPVLDEVGVLESTIRYFSDILRAFERYKIVIITTEEEYRFNYKGSARDTVILSKLLEKKFDNVMSIHYPYMGGKMAHQINYAVNFVKKSFFLQGKDIFALYNADSRPDARTFDWISRFLCNQIGNRSSWVFQQYGNYLGNHSGIFREPNLLKRTILISASLWQNRWSIGFEIPHSLNQFKIKKTQWVLFDPMNYCIGHGLFFSYKIHEKIGGFSENTHNEDAIFGLKLSYYREAIIPIPFFDNSYSPDSIKSLFFQKASWFFGPLQAFEYYRQITRDDFLVEKSRLLVLTMKLFSHAVYWVVGPLSMFFLFVYSVLSNTMIVWAFFLLAYVSFLVMPSLFSWRIMRGKDGVSTLVIIAHLFVGSLFFYILHGFSGLWSALRYIGYVVFGCSIRKNKTIMLTNNYS